MQKVNSACTKNPTPRLKLFLDVLSHSFGNAANKATTSHQRYELEKRQWQSQHPEATPAEYSTAMLEIARRCGV